MPIIRLSDLAHALIQAKKQLEPDVALVFVPPLGAAAAIIEAVEAEVPLIVSVAEGASSFGSDRAS